MTFFEPEANRAGRIRIFLRTQLPLLAGAVFLALATEIAAPDDLGIGTLLWSGLVVIVVASIAAVGVPWERFASSWMIIVPVVDIFGVAMMRVELYPLVPAIGMLVIFPVLWLSYGFRQWVLFIAIGGAILVTTLPFFIGGDWPTSGIGWLNVVALPSIVVGIAIIVNVAAGQLRRYGASLAVASQEQTAALRRALDNEILSRSILDTVNAGVAFYSPTNTLLLSNRLARDMVGAVGFRLDEPPYAGEQVLAADRASTIPFDEQIIPRALRGELIENHMEWVGPPEQQTAIIASSRQVRREDGELLGTVVLAYDVTELVAAVAVREEFLGTVSHELRTPLTSVLGYLELINDDLSPDQQEARGYMEVVRRSMVRLADRVSDLLSAADTDIVLKRETADLSGLLASCIEHAGQHAGQRAVTIIGPAEEPVLAFIDVERIRTVFSELIANAIKFGPRGGTVTIACTVMHEAVEVSVENEGPSLSRAEQSRAFDRFYRAQSSRDNAVQGFGLGLFVAKNIVETHQGRITIGDRSGSGTRVTVTLPLVDSTES